MGMTRSADYYSPLPGCERIASTERSARSTANRSTIDIRNSHTSTSSLLPSSSSSSPSSLGSPSALLSPSSPSSSSSSSTSSSFLRYRQEGGGRLLLDPLPLHGGETKRAELPEVVLTEVAQLVGHPNTARVLLHNTNKSSYTHLPLPSFSTAPSSTGNSTGNSTVSTGSTAENLPASTSSTSTSSVMSSRLGDVADKVEICPSKSSNSHSGGINGRPAHLVSLSSSGTELHHVGMRHSSHIPLPLSRTPSPLEEREGSSKFGLSDSYSPDCSPPGSPNLNQNRRLSEPSSSLSPLPSPRSSQNMSLSRSAAIDLTGEEESNDNEESKKSSSHAIGFICNNNNMDISSDSDSSPPMSNSSPPMSTKNNNNNSTAGPQPNENLRGGYFLTVISGGSLPGGTETRQTIRVGPGPWKVAVVPACPIARARLLRRRALLAARFGNPGGNSSSPSTEQQESESRPVHNSRSLPQTHSHQHHHRHYHHHHNQPLHHPQCQHHQHASRQQQQQHQQQQQQNVQRSPMAKRSSLSQVQSLRLPSRHNNGVPPVVQNIKILSRSREIELKKALLLQQQRQRLSQSGTLEVLANAVTDLHMHESKLS